MGDFLSGLFGSGGGPSLGGPLGGGTNTGGINIGFPGIDIGLGKNAGQSPPSSSSNNTQNPLSNLTLPLLLMGLLGAAGAFPQNYEKSGTADTTTDTTGKTTLDTLSNFLTNLTQQQAGTTGVMPTLSPETYYLMHQLMGRYQGMAAPSLTGYEAQQTGNINQLANTQQQALNNILAARGLSTSPVAATAQAGVEQNRLNQIANVKQSLPLLQNQLNLQNLAGASAFFSAIPKGTLTTTNQQVTGQTTGQQTGSQTGTSQQTGTTKGTTSEKGTSGGGLGGLLTGAGVGLATLLPYLLGNIPGLKIPGLKIPGTNTGTKTPFVDSYGNPIGDETGSGPPAVTAPAQQKVY